MRANHLDQSKGPQRLVDLSTPVSVVLAGLAVGLGAGVLARIAMRVVAMLVQQSPSFTLGGSIGILMLFAILGVVLSAVVWLVRRGLRLRPLTAGLAVGLTLAALLAMPLFSIGSEEAAGVSPWTVVLLFLPLPVLMGPGCAYGCAWLSARLSSGVARTIPLKWFAALSAGAIIAFVNLAAALSGPLRHPALVQSVLLPSRVSMNGVSDAVRAMGLLIAIAYLGLCGWAVWRHAPSTVYAKNSLLVLVVAGLLLPSATQMPFVLGWLPDGAIMLGIVQALGLAALAALFVVQTQRRLYWQTIVVAIAWLIAAAWLVAPTLQSVAWMEWVVCIALTGALAVVAWTAWLREGGSDRLVLGLFAQLLAFLWMAVLTLPGWGLRNLTGLQTLLAVPAFWTVFLMLPTALVAARRATDPGSDYPSEIRTAPLKAA